MAIREAGAKGKCSIGSSKEQRHNQVCKADLEQHDGGKFRCPECGLVMDPTRDAYSDGYQRVSSPTSRIGR